MDSILLKHNENERFSLWLFLRLCSLTSDSQQMLVRCIAKYMHYQTMIIFSNKKDKLWKG